MGEGLSAVPIMGRAQQRVIRNDDEGWISGRREGFPEPFKFCRQCPEGLLGARSLFCSHPLTDQEKSQYRASCSQSKDERVMELLTPARSCCNLGLVYNWGGCLLHRGFGENRYVVSQRQINTQRAGSALFLVIALQRAAHLVRLHAHNGVLLRVEIRTPTVNFHTDEIFVEFFAVPEQRLFANELEKPTLLWGICEVSALEDSAKLFLFFKEGDRFRCGPVLIGHWRLSQLLCSGRPTALHR